MKIKIVTGYAPIPNHPRSAEEYGRLGEQLFNGIKAPVRAFYTKVEQCWLWKHAQNVKHSEGDNPRKNTLAYHIVNHQKPEWLEMAAKEDKQADTFIWMDYGIGHQPGVCPEVINAFLSRVSKGDLAIPGCWATTHDPIDMTYPSWRFCGSVLIVPREYISRLNVEMASVVLSKIKKRQLDWEVNTLARVERLKRLPIRWYHADHDASQFTNYRPHLLSSNGAGLGPVGKSGPATEGMVFQSQAARYWH